MTRSYEEIITYEKIENVDTFDLLRTPFFVGISADESVKLEQERQDRLEKITDYELETVKNVIEKEIKFRNSQLTIKDRFIKWYSKDRGSAFWGYIIFIGIILLPFLL